IPSWTCRFLRVAAGIQHHGSASYPPSSRGNTATTADRSVVIEISTPTQHLRLMNCRSRSFGSGHPAASHSRRQAFQRFISIARFSFWSQRFRKYRLKLDRSPSARCDTYCWRIFSLSRNPPFSLRLGLTLIHVASLAGSSSGEAPKIRPKNVGSSTTPSLIFRAFSCSRHARGDSDLTPAVVIAMVSVCLRVKPPFVRTSQFSRCLRVRQR